MLYRNPETTLRPGPIGIFRRTIEALGRRRRQRLTSLDLMALSVHRRRDLGLADFPFGDAT
jgi:hypothetical protein